MEVHLQLYALVSATIFALFVSMSVNIFTILSACMMYSSGATGPGA